MRFPTSLFAIVFFLVEWFQKGINVVHGLSVEDMLEELYCGNDNCYNLLGVPGNASKLDIRKAYRRLSIQYHPDRNPSTNAAEQFRKLAKAQEVLSNDANREAYDYYLAHPSSILALYYGIRAIYPSQTHPFAVLGLVLFFGSLGQYLNSKWRRKWLISVVEQTPQFKRSMDAEIESRFGARFRRMDEKEKEVVRNEIKYLLLDTVQLNGEIVGSSSPPFRMQDIFAIRCLLCPYKLLQWIRTTIRWTWKYRIMKHEYTTEDQLVMTRWLLGISMKQWNVMEQDEREELLNRELWVMDNLQKYELEREKEERENRSNSTRYRQWKRSKRKNR